MRDWSFPEWSLVAILVLIVGLVGYMIWDEANYETVCPEGYSMVGDVDTNVGVGPVVGGKPGAVGVVVSSDDDRICVRVEGEQIIQAEPIRVRETP